MTGNQIESNHFNDVQEKEIDRKNRILKAVKLEIKGQYRFFFLTLNSIWCLRNEREIKIYILH